MGNEQLPHFFRFRLRHLFLVTLVLSVIFAFVSWQIMLLALGCMVIVGIPALVGYAIGAPYGDEERTVGAFIGLMASVAALLYILFGDRVH